MSTESQIAALERALERGVTEVEENGRRVRYPSLREIGDTLARLKSSAATKRRGRPFGVVTFKSSGSI